MTHVNFYFHCTKNEVEDLVTFTEEIFYRKLFVQFLNSSGNMNIFKLLVSTAFSIFIYFSFPLIYLLI